MTKLSDTGYHEGVTEATKVRKFIEGIKAPALKEAVACALMSSEIKNNFTKCASYFRDAVAKFTPKPSVQMAAVHTDGNQTDENGTIDADQVVFKYYPPRQYARFTPAARTKLRALREAAKAEKRKGKKGSNDGGSKKRQRPASVSSDPTSDDESSVENDTS